MPFLQKGNVRIRYEEEENIALAVRHVRSFLRANRPAGSGDLSTKGQAGVLTTAV